MDTNDAVTVIIPVLDGKLNNAARTLFSVYCCDYSNIRVIMVYQGLDHDCLNNLKSFTEPYRELDIVILHDMTEITDKARCLELGIGGSGSRYACFVDEGAVLYPHHISTLVRKLRESGKAWASSRSCVDFEIDGYIVKKDCMGKIRLDNNSSGITRLALPCILIDTTRIKFEDLSGYILGGCEGGNLYLSPEFASYLEPVECEEITSVIRVKIEDSGLAEQMEKMSRYDGRENIAKLLLRGHIRKVIRQVRSILSAGAGRIS